MRRFLMTSTAFTPVALFAAEKGGGHSDEDLAGLTAEERAGLLDDDVVDDGDTAGLAAAKAKEDAAGKKTEEKKPAEDDKPDETTKLSRAEVDAAADAAVAEVTGKKGEAEKKATDDRAQVDKDAEAAAKAAAEGKEAKTEDTKPAAETEADDERSSVPAWVVPADADKKLKEISASKAELAEKFDAGDLSAKDYQTELDKLIGQERDIHDAALLAKAGHDMRVNSWTQDTVPDFLDEHPQYRSNETLNGMLDSEVRKLQVAASKDGKNPFSPKILAKAHANITGAIEALTGKPVETKPAAETKPGAKARTEPERPKLPPTLAKVPAAEATETVSDRFASLNKLADSNPEAFQRALEKLPEDVRDAYLASSPN